MSKRDDDLIWWAKICAYGVIGFGLIGAITGLTLEVIKWQLN